MALNVRDGLLRNAEQRGVARIRQLHRRADKFKRNRRPRLAVFMCLARFAHEQLQCGSQAEIIQQRRAQVVRHAPHLAQRAVQPVERPAQHAARPFDRRRRCR